MTQKEQTVNNECELITQKDQQRIRELTLMDDDFMTKCFDGDNESIELILQIILHRQDLKVIEVKVQNVIKNLKGKSATLDVLAQDISGRVYNIEIQNENKGAKPKRARYHSSLMDANLLKAGQEEEEHPETYMIFITKKDKWGHNMPVYFIERMNLQTGKKFGDDAHIVYVNGAYRGNDPVGKLMHDFSCPNPDDMFYGLLAEQTRKYKDCDERSEHMGYIQEIREETRRTTIEKERELFALRLLKKGKASLEEIAEYTEFTMEQVQELANRLKDIVA